MLQKLALYIGMPLLASPVFAQEFPSTKKEVLDKTSSCTSNSKEIIGSQEDDFVKMFLKTGFKDDFLGTFGTTVHECLHSYDSDLSEGLEWDSDTYPIAYFVDKDIVIRFAGKRLFKTDELHKTFFPKDVKNLFRYGTYVQAASGPSTASSNQWGIYGLLEEFNAYYHDVRSQIEYFKCDAFDGAYNETFGNSMHAYFEFNIFMANYISYAKLYKPVDYGYMLANHDLRLAYTLIEMNWRNLLTEIMSDRNLASRMPGYDEELRLFNEDLQKVMDDFMIKGEDLSKYKSFVDNRPSDMSVVVKNKDWAEQLNLTGFGAGMNAEEMTAMYEGFEDFELEFEEKDPEKFYVVVMTTKSEEELMNIIFASYPNYKKIGVLMDFELNFSVYLNKFSSKSKAEKFASEVKDEFPDVKVL